MTDEITDDIMRAELEKLKSLKNAYKAKNKSKTRLLERVRYGIADVVANIVDEGDRAYFGSTNDADELRYLATEVEGWKWDDILRKSDGDPYATIREQRNRADSAEAELSRLRAENERLREALKPFAAVNQKHVRTGIWHHHDEIAEQILSADDFSRARAALKGGE